MTKTTFPRIQKVADLGDMRLALVFDDKRVVIVDFSDTAGKGGVFEPLADPVFFAKAKPVRHGRALAWPGDLEFCSDALHGEGVRARRISPAKTPFSAKVFELA